MDQTKAIKPEAGDVLVMREEHLLFTGGITFVPVTSDAQDFAAVLLNGDNIG